MTNNREILKTNQAATEFLEETLKRTCNWNDLTDEDKSVIQKNILKALQDDANVDTALANYNYFISTNFLDVTKFLDATKDLLFNHHKSNLSLDKFLKKIFQYNVTIDPKLVELQSTLIKYALAHGAAIDDLTIPLEVLSAHKDFLLEHHNASTFLSLVLEYQNYEIHNSSDTPKQALKRESEKKILIESLAKYAIDKGANLNTKESPEELALTLFEELFVSNMFDMIDYAQNINGKSSYTLSTITWMAAIAKNFNITFISNALQRFSNGFAEEELFELARSHGASHSSIHTLLDIYYLAIDFNKTKVGETAATLSKTELQILDPDKSISISDCESGNYQNPYGFSPLSLALMSGKYELAIEMIENGHSLTKKNINGITPVSIIHKLSDNSRSQDIFKLLNTAFKKLDTLDISLNDQEESLIDTFLEDGNLKDEALNKTNDPLFTFYKPDATLFEPLLHPEKTHIAISMGEGFWSTGANSLSRLISREHPDSIFYFVTLEMMEKGGDEFIKQFNGWINPGAGGYYPQEEFNKNTWEPDTLLEKAYQKALDKTYEFKIPYLGICAGAQQLVLFHDGYVQPVKKYSSGQHFVTYLKGTLSHFMAMTHEQQTKTLQHCELPEINFKGDTAHQYAAVIDKLGEGLQLGAVSEEGVAMSYSHENGLRHATQFHPEHYYHLQHIEGGGINHQKVWFENFIHLTKLHHDHVQNGATHPEVIFEHISERLEECLKTPTCLSEKNAFNNSSISELLFDY